MTTAIGRRLRRVEARYDAGAGWHLIVQGGGISIAASRRERLKRPA